MSNPQNPSPNPDATKAEEIPLEDIDKLLEAEDPEFTKSLEEVRTVEVDKSVEIEATVPDDGLGEEDVSAAAIEPSGLNGKLRQNGRMITAAVRNRLTAARIRIKSRLSTLGVDLLIFLRTRPKEFALYSLGTAKLLFKKSAVPLTVFRSAGRGQKIAAVTLATVLGTSVWILLANFKGIWIPQITEPILRSFESHADWVETFDPKEEGESFYSAFPQERFEFLFRKIKVNLKRTRENPNPMGAFEMIVLVDSKDTGIEVRDREVEFFDLLQRCLEEETFTDLATEMGKTKLKSKLKRELNQKLTQGWVKDISFGTFILKP